MKANDPVLQEQLHHLVHTGRKSINAKTMIVATSFHDEEVDALATMAVFSTQDENDDSVDQLQDIINVMSRTLNSFLHEYSSLQVVLVCKETGEKFPVGEGSFGQHVAELKRD